MENDKERAGVLWFLHRKVPKVPENGLATERSEVATPSSEAKMAVLVFSGFGAKKDIVFLLKILNLSLSLNKIIIRKDRIEEKKMKEKIY